jgi:hypothetical protein
MTHANIPDPTAQPPVALVRELASPASPYSESLAVVLEMISTLDEVQRIAHEMQASLFRPGVAVMPATRLRADILPLLRRIVDASSYAGATR